MAKMNLKPQKVDVKAFQGLGQGQGNVKEKGIQIKKNQIKDIGGAKFYCPSNQQSKPVDIFRKYKIDDAHEILTQEMFDFATMQIQFLTEQYLGESKQEVGEKVIKFVKEKNGLQMASLIDQIYSRHDFKNILKRTTALF